MPGCTGTFVRTRGGSRCAGLQRTKDGRFGVEYAECLASCGTGPVMMCNDDFYENISNDRADEILEKYDE
ncbi:MAG: hypothetical protein CM1200mP29_01830 [Verrucomicrobiota bacterium]|nr:MAG: hypothetical protein CM1200mP29_01830 [Verrucomicrobiota bacterium]